MLTPFQSQIIVDAGIAFGDEGKGRLVYEVIQELRERTGNPSPVGMVVKVNGGANSGHTAGGLKLNLLPGGVIDRSVAALGIASGVVADPRKLHWETAATEAKGFTVAKRLLIDERVMVSDLSHRLLDLAWEHYRVHTLGEPARGSTGRGITPAYLDEVGQWQIFYADFRKDRDSFARRLSTRMARATDTIRHVCKVSPEAWESFFQILTDAEKRANETAVIDGVFPASEFDFCRFKGTEPFTLNTEAVVDAYWTAGQIWLDRIVDLRERTLGILAGGQSVIGEFGQSYWLDKRHGFAPNVTASHTFTPEIFESLGIPLQAVHRIGVAKAYDTKVGTHLFLSEIEKDHPLSARLSRLEFGTSTGRQRMVGWFDAVEKGTALRYAGFEDIVINKLDAMGFPVGTEPGTLRICTAYEDAAGNRYRQVPRDDEVRSRLRAVYLDLPGWTGDISTVRSWTGLPENARRYVSHLLRSVLECAGALPGSGLPVPNLRYIGVGPNPDEIIADIPSSAAILDEFPA